MRIWFYVCVEVEAGSRIVGGSEGSKKQSCTWSKSDTLELLAALPSHYGIEKEEQQHLRPKNVLLNVGQSPV